MRILFIEDRGSVSVPVTETLELDGYEVISAYDINDAQSAWENREVEPIDCLIIDLNMPADGLTDDQKKQTFGGLLTGWIWLRDYIFKDYPDMRKRTVILSDYLSIFREKVLENQYLGVVTIPKSAPYSPVEMLLKEVKKIAKGGR